MSVLLPPSPSGTFHDAVAAFQSGAFDRAEGLCRDLLAHHLDHAPALHLRGALAQQRGDLESAENFMRKALALQRGGAEIWHAFAGVLAAREKNGEAIEAYQQVLRLKPDHAVALFGLGHVSKASGQVAEAAKAYAQAIGIKPDFVAALNALGLLFCEQKMWDEARACLESALTHSLSGGVPHADTLNNLAVICFETGDYSTAQNLAERALGQKPDYTAALINLGNAFKAQGQWNAAIHSYGRALKIAPANAEARNNIGLAVLHGLGDVDLATAHFHQALAQNSQDIFALTHLGVSHSYRGAFAEAVTCFQNVLALNPAYQDARNNLANALRALGRLDEAMVAYRAVIAAQPDNAEARHNLSLALLQDGQFAEGWCAFEQRWQTQQLARGRRNFAQPQWRGEEAAGKILLIHAEQGFGDTLQFCRYASLAAGRGLRVVMEVQSELVRLLDSLAGIERIVARGDTLPPFDLHCPMMSLPLAFATDLDSIPAPSHYLSPPVEDVKAWRDRLTCDESCLRVGLVWAGNPRRFSVDLAAADRRRSLDPVLLKPLLETQGMRFFSLQKNIDALPDNRMENVMADCHDFAATAAFIANLDLVISVDTGVAHLAAAMGKKVWLLNRADTCWRWMMHREDSPWYPSLRLFRQSRLGDWDEVIARVGDELKKSVAEKAQTDQTQD